MRKTSDFKASESESQSSRNASHPTQKDNPLTPTRRLVRTLSASQAARNQASGFAHFRGLKQSFSAPSLDPNPAVVNNTTCPIDPQETERLAHENDKRRVAAEIAAWGKDGVIADDDPRLEDFDLLRFWQVFCLLHIHFRCLLLPY